MLDSKLLIVRGLVGIVIGVLALLSPGATIAVLVGIFAIYAFVDGVTNLFLGVSRRGHDRSWAHLFQGLVGIAAAVLTFMWPGVTLLALVFLIAAWAVTTGIFEIVAAIRLRRVISGEWLLVLSGVLSILFGLVVFAFPAVGALGIAWTLAVYAIASGVVLVVLGVRLRSHPRLVAA
jgi:uncharacterized membrane protein HdeD (DUF308 family)